MSTCDIEMQKIQFNVPTRSEHKSGTAQRACAPELRSWISQTFCLQYSFQFSIQKISHSSGKLGFSMFSMQV